MTEEIYKLNANETKYKNAYRIFHRKYCPDMKLVVKQCGTGIGIHTDVVCLVCGDEFDVTDYDCW